MEINTTVLWIACGAAALLGSVALFLLWRLRLRVEWTEAELERSSFNAETGRLHLRRSLDENATALDALKQDVMTEAEATGRRAADLRSELDQLRIRLARIETRLDAVPATIEKRAAEGRTRIGEVERIARDAEEHVAPLEASLDALRTRLSGIEEQVRDVLREAAAPATENDEEQPEEQSVQQPEEQSAEQSKEQPPKEPMPGHSQGEPLRVEDTEDAPSGAEAQVREAAFSEVMASAASTPSASQAPSQAPSQDAPEAPAVPDTDRAAPPAGDVGGGTHRPPAPPARRATDDRRGRAWWTTGVVLCAAALTGLAHALGLRR